MRRAQDSVVAARGTGLRAEHMVGKAENKVQSTPMLRMNTLMKREETYKAYTFKTGHIDWPSN